MNPLGLVLGLAGIAAQSGWQGAASNVDWANLQFQKRKADQEYRLATAGRSDAYGNKQRYDDLLNEWETILSPMQDKIVRAGENEQLKSLTEDAMRNRKIKVRAAARGDEAAEDYGRALAEFRYGRPPSELATRGELQQLLAGIENSKARRGNTDAIRTAIRQGNSSVIPAVLNATDEDAGLSLPEILLNARNMGLSETQSRNRDFYGTVMPQLDQLAKLMDQGGDMPQRFSTTPERLASEEGQQAAMILQALQTGAAGVGSASGQLSKTLASGGPDLRQLASLINTGSSRSSYPSKSQSRVKYSLGNDDNTGFNWF
jgi:hypothetical protein